MSGDQYGRLTVAAALMTVSLMVGGCSKEARTEAIETIRATSFGKVEEIAVWRKYATSLNTAGTAGAVLGPVLGAWHKVPAPRTLQRHRRTEWSAHTRDAIGYFDSIGALNLLSGSVLFSGQTICLEGELPSGANIAAATAVGTPGTGTPGTPEWSGMLIYPIYLKHRGIEAGTVGTSWMAFAEPDPAGDHSRDRLVLVLLVTSAQTTGGWCDEDTSRIYVSQVINGVRQTRVVEDTMHYIEIIGNDLPTATIRPLADNGVLEAAVNDALSAGAVVGFVP